MLTLKSGTNEKGELEYYLVGLEGWDDFDIVVNQLKHLGARVIESLDGIFFRIADLDEGEIKFKVIYHEDVGVYSYIIGQSSSQLNSRLEQILEQVVNEINLRWYLPSQ